MTSPRRPSSASKAPGSAASPAGSPMKVAANAAAMPAGGAGDAGGIAAASNESRMWELLYNLEWQMPLEELQALWTDALGESGVPPLLTQLAFAVALDMISVGFNTAMPAGADHARCSLRLDLQE